MISAPRSLGAGKIKRIHVNKHVIAKNLKHGTDLPAISIQHTGGPTPARVVAIHGPSLMRSDKPLKCGARVYIETTAEITYE
jgi:hypothetical protein